MTYKEHSVNDTNTYLVEASLLDVPLVQLEDSDSDEVADRAHTQHLQQEREWK